MKKGYDVLIFVNDVTDKILSRDSNYIVDVVTWPKFGNSKIFMREVIITSSLQGFDQKNHFFWRVVLVQVQQFGTDTRNELEILHQCGKTIKTKSQKVLGGNSYICRSYKGKTGRGPFCPHPSPPPSSGIGLKDRIYVILVIHILLWNEILMLQNQIMQKETNALDLKIRHHLSTAF